MKNSGFPETDFQNWLSQKHACTEGREWVGGRGPEQAWAEMERGDWLLWWADKAGVSKIDIVRVACKIARNALQFVKPGELRPLKAIETAEDWCEGKATMEQVREARDAAVDAYAAAEAYDADAYAAAAAAVATAADAADADASAAASAAAAYAADAAAYAAASAARIYSDRWHEVRASKMREHASIVREMISYPGAQK